MTGNSFIRTPVMGVYARYTDAQKARHDLILAGFSSTEVEIVLRNELQGRIDLPDNLPEHAFVLMLHADAGQALDQAAELMSAHHPLSLAGLKQTLSPPSSRSP